MWFFHLHDVLSLFFHLNHFWAEATITLGAALLIGCAASCVSSPSQDNDDLFGKHVS